jgi:hypothetical protein
MAAELASKKLRFFKKLGNTQNPKKKSLSVNFNHALFSLSSIHDDLVMQAFVWFSMGSGSEQSSLARSGTARSSSALHMQI